ncbi:nuclear transport factor 2 family protein [Streptomyces sp. TRM 70361]|uniref:nuclear transport factor 2 family protein n=1 Tax=Streptomyces sp. TRM 70361 TaxID=3116553 RepID=UPI002E7AD6F3|nr:nuclear transport factor 2 family protein [Streptomyces sp. TRM 70361]MEE1938419.1 nuclear transport factor 2 family protein [Streptomyces sp. TRM 70361]
MSDHVNPQNADGRGRRDALRLVGGGALLAAPLLTAAPSAARAAQAAPATPAASAATRRERRLKRLTLDAFHRQARGGDFFDILADDVVWTVAAAAPGTHHGKAAFLTRGAAPVTARLSTPIIPTVRDIWAEKDTVVVHWDGEAVARDGLPYRNTYAWIWTFRGDRVARAVAFLDLVELNKLFDRVPLPE